MALNGSNSTRNDNANENNSYTPPNRGNSPKSAKHVPLPLKMLRFCITMVIGAFIFANIKPYEVIATQFLSSFDYNSIASIISSIPILGGLIQFITKFFAFGLGTALWCIFQILELLPLILFGHGRFLNNQIGKHGKAAKYPVSGNDSWETKAAKFLGNSLSTEVMRFLVVMAIGVYVLDFLLILTVYPPVKGNFGDFLYIIQTAQWDKINWVNVLVSFCVLFAVEFLVKLQGVVKQVIEDLA
ncbi:MAG: hypothetical protein KME29_12200 [Calothrix sp. FI2-JRJ7]|jgi:hypothetical protein|nr:hypothetical protein [Calothrix sp. FI2-JRJ7]